jgi:prolyl-tRNA synthetase
MNAIAELLIQYRVYFDRSDERIGRKFNKWEKIGVPIRIEVGKKEFENNMVSIFRRDEMKRVQQKIYDLGAIHKTFADIEKNMHQKAKDKLMEHIVTNNNWDDFTRNIKNNAVLVSWCGSDNCEKDICDTVKQSHQFSIKTLCIPFEMQNTENKKCVKCQSDAIKNVLFGRSF